MGLGNFFNFYPWNCGNYLILWLALSDIRLVRLGQGVSASAGNGNGNEMPTAVPILLPAHTVSV